MRGVAHTVTGSDHLLADNGLLHDQVLEIFGRIFAGQSPFQMPVIA
jgi:hypothetical protein